MRREQNVHGGKLKAAPDGVKKFVAERRGKLASYEVAGGGEQNKFVPRGTVEASGHFPASFHERTRRCVRLDWFYVQNRARYESIVHASALRHKMKTKKAEIVEELKAKYQARLKRAENELAKSRTKKSPEVFDADIFLFQKWAYRVGKGWYGFSLGDIPSVWRDVLDDFLAWVELQCPHFEIRQIKMKLGGLRFHIYMKSEDAVLNEKVRSEIFKLEALLRHEKHRQH